MSLSLTSFAVSSSTITYDGSDDCLAQTANAQTLHRFGEPPSTSAARTRTDWVTGSMVMASRATSPSPPVTRPPTETTTLSSGQGALISLVGLLFAAVWKVPNSV